MKVTIDKKIKLLNGIDVWHTAKIEGELPSILLSDGPSGLRKQIDNMDNLGINSSEKATLHPALVTLACTFNQELAFKMGDALGKEAKSQGVNVLLAPGINIKRNPMCGRNFEYFSEDPILSGTLAYSYIKGVQSNNVGCSLKHFAVNNQEDYRFNIDAIVDERALKEIYLKNFYLALKAKPKTVMCSYNKINGTLASENKWLLTTVLREEFKYDGVVVSDWGAVSNPVKSLKAGLDLQMPSTYGYAYKEINKAYKKNLVSEEEINRSANRIIRLVNELKDEKKEDLDRIYVEKVAKEVALEGIVLLKNEGNILPFNKDEKILIVGEFAKNPRNQGGGSSFVNPHSTYSLLSYIDKYTSNYKYVRGYDLEKLDDDSLISEVVEVAKDFDKVLIMTGLPESYETEGYDRNNIDIPKVHLKLIEEVSKVNSNIVVNLYTGSAVSMPFISQVKGIINSHLLGFDSGMPLLDIVFGVVSPSGRLPYTNPLRITDDITTKNFANSNNAIYYLESIYVGYRYFETFNKKVLFPFGYGLSYSNFSYSDLTVDTDTIRIDGKINVKVKVKNVGKYKASEVVLLFIKNNKSSVHKPLRELRKYTKITLDVGEEKEVEFTLDYDDFTYYDVNLKKFYVNKGIYEVEICKNARDVILSKEIKKLDEDIDFIPHEKSKYFNVDEVTEEDFQKLFNYKLPPKNLKKSKPYSLDNNLEEVKHTFIGKIMCNMIIKEAKKIYKSTNNEWIIEVINNTIMKTPLRTIAMMSNKTLSLYQMQGLVDLMNYRIIKGLINIWRK